MEKWSFLLDLQEEFKFDITENGDRAVITNRDNGKYIEVIEERYNTNTARTETYVEYTVCFATQHRHYDDTEDAADYIRQLLTDGILPLEFYREGKNRFGCDIEREKLGGLSPEVLADAVGYRVDHLSQFEFEIHSWSGRYDVTRTNVADAGYIKMG